MDNTKSLKQLLLAEPNIDIRKIFTHNDIIFTIKNQDPILKTIFTYDNIHILISYLKQQHQIQTNNKDLCFKMPLSAMEIICCQSHNLTQLIFESGKKQQDLVKSQSQQTDNKSPNNNNLSLLEFLLQFLDQKQHYYLAGLFSKSMGSLTKRAFAPSHKYNKILCDKIFRMSETQGGNIVKSSYLFKALNHIYSQSVNQLILRWLTLKALINMESGQQSTITHIKNFNQDSVHSITNLIMLLLKSPLQPPPQRPQPLEHKNLNLLINKNSQKQLYQLVCKQKHLREILKPIPNPCLNKLLLIKKIIQQYRIQNQQIQKKQQKYINIHLSDVIDEQMLIQCVGWINQNLLNISQKLQYQQSQSLQQENRKITQSSKQQINKKELILYLQILYQFHLLTQQMRQPLTFYYQQKQKEHVNIIIKFLRLKNDIINNLLTKIIFIVLEKFNCIDFATALLHYGIVNVIDQNGIREHVLQWAKIILKSKNQQAHIYENVEEQARWDHMSEIVANAEDIVIGKYRFKPTNLDTFYSVQKAKQYYNFFLQEPIIIQYEQKVLSKKIQSQPSQKHNQSQIQFLQQISLKKKLSSPQKFSALIQTIQLKIQKQDNKHVIAKKQKQEQILKEQNVDVLGLDSIRQGYLFYNIQDIIQQVQ